MLYPHHDRVSQDCPGLPAKVGELAGSVSVARVRPRTSKGITDLLLPHFLRLNAGRRSKKPAASQSRPGYLAAWGLVRYRN